MVMIPFDGADESSANDGKSQLSHAELAARLRMAIARLARALRQQSHRGLTPSQQGILATVNDRGPITPGQLANREQVSAPSISRAVAGLEGVGLLKRQPDERDGRSIQVTLTDAGRNQLESARNLRNAWLALRLAQLDAGERMRLADAIEVLELLTEPPATDEPRSEPAADYLEEA